MAQGPGKCSDAPVHGSSADEQLAPVGATALVVWGSTGRRVYFTKDDLQIPQHVKQLPHAHFYAKQWDAVAGHWYNRVLKQSSLQHLQIEDIVRCIEQDIEKRWQTRKAGHAAHKRRKRLLTRAGAAGTPSTRILLTNIVALDQFACMSADEKSELVDAVVQQVESVTRHKVCGVEVLVDDADAGTGTRSGDVAAVALDVSAEASHKRARVEVAQVAHASAAPLHAPDEASGLTRHDVVDINASADVCDGGEVVTAPQDVQAPFFDDHVAVVCALPSVEVAAHAVARLHRCRFDGRRVVCRFWSS